MAKWFSKKIYEGRRWRKCARAYAESKLFICERCHCPVKPNIGKERHWVVHHREELTPDNIHDDMIVYGWDNLMLLCDSCHKIVHGRDSSQRVMKFDSDGQLVGFTESSPPV